MEERFRTNECFDTFEEFLDFHYPKNRVPQGWTPPPNNSLGYRTPEITSEKPINIMTFGGSCTEASNYEHQEIFTGVLCRLVSESLGVEIGNWNLGLGGGGYDFVARTLMCGMPALKPDVVIIVFPTATRRELFKKNGRRIRLDMSTSKSVQLGLVTPIPESRYYYDLWPKVDSNFDDTVNVIKNFKMIELLLTQYGVPWGYCVDGYSENLDGMEMYWSKGWLSKERHFGFDFDVIDQVAEDDVHPGLESHTLFGQRLAEWVIQNHGDALKKKAAEA